MKISQQIAHHDFVQLHDFARVWLMLLLKSMVPIDPIVLTVSLIVVGKSHD